MIMDPQEIRDKIMAAINGIIKDDPAEAGEPTANLHDVLAAKMRARMNPDGEATEVDLDPEIDPETPTGDE
jgi:hypothetical protein